MSKYIEYKEIVNTSVDIIFKDIRNDIDNIINFAENAQGKEELQNILDTVIADLKGFRKELDQIEK